MMHTVTLDNITLINGDCMEYLATLPDGAVDLAVVDPPYGLGKRLIEGGAKGGMGSLKNLADNKFKKWDKPPGKEYFYELFRVATNQIIWGGNYFFNYLGSNDGILIWDKLNGTNPLSDAEIAWKSLEGTTRIFRMHHFSAGYDDKTHPTQKPTALYRWLLQNYAKPGQTILDTHLGSGSSAIAAWEMGYAFTGIEIDREYFDAAVERIKRRMAQPYLPMAINEVAKAEQQPLFNSPHPTY